MKRRNNGKLKRGAHLHFIGIGGIGMSAIAWVMSARGYRVTGSDISEGLTVKHLESHDIRVFRGHHESNIEGADVVVVSSAIRSDNPELTAAERSGIPVWRRAKMLGEIVNARSGVVVTGTHGKTTITGMISFLFHRAGLDPTCLVGGILDEFGGNALVGNSEWVVAEGDESDGSFRYLHPKFAIVNNVEPDHLDYFANVDEIYKAFQEFLSGTAPDGEIWISADCEGARVVRSNLGRSARSYGASDEADLRYTDYVHDVSESHALLFLDGKPLGQLSLSIPGRFNMHNAVAAVAAGLYAGLPFPQIAEILVQYSGTQRRLEVKGRTRGITIIDDYAHHPTEIRATVDALRENFHGRRVGVFQPHRYSRTHHLRDQFSTAFQDLDLLILTDVYPAGESPMEGVDGETLFRATRRNHHDVVYVPCLEEIPDHLVHVLREGDVLITMGAGNVWQVGEKLLDHLRRNPKNRTGVCQ
ncbi:MAG: UDP-N-acetylmuramate--L-alanine ligase [bacterium]